jgi:nitroreductase
MIPDTAWRPRRFDAADPAGRAEVAALSGNGTVTGTHDTIVEQLAELVTGRRPALSARPDLVAPQVAEHLAGVPAGEYGSWVFYPWSGRLVHVLPEAEFREVRHDRNRYKITAAEQEALAARRIGVIGLSVGAAVAVTLAQEGVGRRFRLADPDHLSLSNTNRLRASVADLGVAKVVLAARQMFEIDPYLDIRIWPAGLTADTVDDFLAGGDPLDLLIEECDDVVLKVLARERARAHRIPVIMETNERGMLDVERYDLEPDRPLLHGLLGAVGATDLAALSPRERIPVVLAILGGSDHSPRFAPSLIEIGETIGSWPQLASGVALGAATATDAARRLLLGDLRVSGRFYVDLDRLVRAGAEAPLPSPVAPPVGPGEAPDPPRPERGVPLDAEGMRRLVGLAVRAPSGGNVQPWRFTAGPGLLRCRIDERRPATRLDAGRAATHLAIGAAVENIVLGAAAAGHRADVRLFPDPADPGLVCELRFTDAPDLPVPSLAAEITRRVTNRRPGDGRPLADGPAAALAECAAEAGARLDLVTDRSRMTELGDVLGAGDRLRFLAEPLHREMMAELRWTAADARRTGDGIDVAALELDGVDLAFLRLARDWSNLAPLLQFGGGAALERPARAAVAGSSALGVLSVPGGAPHDHFLGGRAMQRMWLTATSLGLAVQPMTALLYMFPLVDAPTADSGLNDRQRATLGGLRDRFAELVPLPAGHRAVLLFRLAYAGPPSVRAARRPVEAVLSFDDR